MSMAIANVVGPETVLLEAEVWQAAFFDCRGKLCPDLPSPAHADRYLDFLEHRIARYPGDLRAHVRRIMLARANGKRRQVAAGLYDLFRVLDNRGEGLRAHLLDLCAPELDAESIESLRRLAISPAATNSALALATRTMGKHVPARRPADAAAPLLAEALDYLDAGQIDEARSLLETILEATPDNVEATRTLLDIYLRARDRQAFASLRTRLEPLPDPTRPLWDAMAARLAALP